MEKGVDLVLKEIDAMAIPVEKPEAILNIATVSASGSQEVGKIIFDAIDKVGKEGVITIEEGKLMQSKLKWQYSLYMLQM